ncbi:MAG: NAD(P)-dependent methylenetetrahydromethanopterin dehydrogenase [Planctomycetota bacterium]
MKSILIQFDSDEHPSVFDRVVAVDSGVEHLFSYGSITPDHVTALTHGAMFTRGPSELKNTAIFVGGSDVSRGEAVLRKIQKAFFGPMRVSVMMDSNGCNTTAAAAIASARKHLALKGTRAAVLGATGPVGLRAAELLALEGTEVTLVSRAIDRAMQACETVSGKVSGAQVTALSARDAAATEAICHGHQLVVAAGAAGVTFLSEGALSRISGLKIAIDLNAVPPLGIADISVSDKAADKSGVLCFGALGVGGLKMKVHRQAIASLFESNDRILETRAIYDLALKVAGLM